ncbi:hypothetical protein [Chroococcidiopsis sp. SAG 2025]|uniref:hypothetical protein n=1 Tax=Chroococcidiopsis sp. SAG 2025 TaxID=171389 RepID=UPI002937411D|nr:hypothetical protein [Chroococcidiopsis sp. SAG 2025]
MAIALGLIEFALTVQANSDRYTKLQAVKVYFAPLCRRHHKLYSHYGSSIQPQASRNAEFCTPTEPACRISLNTVILLLVTDNRIS